MPYSQLVARGQVPATRNFGDRLLALLRFFGVASVRGWEALWQDPDASFRRSTAFSHSPEATSAWLRLAEIKARAIESAPFDKAAFKDAARDVRGWVAEPLTPDLIRRIQRSFAAAGVVLVVVEELPKTRASGATRWLSADRALIALSLRYGRDDRFWFTLFHEVAHVLLHGKRQMFVDVIRGDRNAESEASEEGEADRFASDVLVPRTLIPRLRELTSEAEIRAFAEELNVSPGVIAGRVQRETGAWHEFNDLRAKVNKADLLSDAA